MAKIIVKISKGKSTVAVEGFPGPGCRDLSAAMERHLGKVTTDQETPEAYEQAKTQISNNAG